MRSCTYSNFSTGCGFWGHKQPTQCSNSFLNFLLFHHVPVCVPVHVRMFVAGCWLLRMFMALSGNVTKYATVDCVYVYRCRCRWLKLIYVNVQNVFDDFKIYHPIEPTNQVLHIRYVVCICCTQCKKSKLFLCLFLLLKISTWKVNAKCDHACKQNAREVCTLSLFLTILNGWFVLT